MPGSRTHIIDPAIRLSVAAVYLTALIQGMVGVTFSASGALLKERLEIGNTLYGAMFIPGLSLSLITTLSGQLLLRRWSLRSLYLFALGMQSVVLCLLAAGGLLGPGIGLAVLIWGLCLSGAVAGMIWLAINTAAIELFPSGRSGALSALHGMFGTGATVGPLIIASFIGVGFWAGAPLVTGLLPLILLAIVRPRQIHGVTGERPRRTAASIIPRSLRLHSLTAVLYGIGESLFAAWAVIFLAESRGLGPENAAAAISAYWLTMTVGRLGAGFVLRRVPAVGLALLLCGLMALSYLVVSGSQGPTDAALRMAFAGLACSALFPMLMGIASTDHPGHTPQVSTSMMAAVIVGLAIGSFAVGPLRESIGLERVFRMAPVVPLLLAGLLLVLRRLRCTEIQAGLRTAEPERV